MKGKVTEMNIVWISPECPYPANTGGRIGIWKRIINMSENDNIYFYCIIDNEEEQKYADEIKRYCKEVHFYNRQKGFASLIKSITEPYPAVTRWNKKMSLDIEEKCRTNEIDYVIVDFPQMLGVLSDEVKSKNRIILNQHNIEFKAMRNIANEIHNPVKTLVYKVVSSQLKKYESNIYKKDYIELYTFVSTEDKAFFEKEYNKSNTYLVPVGTDLKFAENVKESHEISFIGKMSYPANEAAAIWFLENAWNQVLMKCPDAKLHLVGKEPTEELITTASKYKNVNVTGMVESVDEYYECSQLIIIPLLTGGGVKVKLLEALGHGSIVVTTRKGIEGTDFLDQEHVIERNDADQFAEACIDVLQNPQKYEKIRKKAMQKIEDEYSWKEIVIRFRNYINSRLD